MGTVSPARNRAARRLSSRTQARARTAHDRPRREILPADRARRAGDLTGLRIDGRSIDMRVGRRLLGATLERNLTANQLTISLDDSDRRVLTSGVLGLGVLTRVAELTIDGLPYSVVGLGRQGDTLTITAEDSIVSYLKRIRGRAITVSRNKMTRLQFCAMLIRAAGVPCIVLDEDVIQPRAGAKKLRTELEKARREQADDARDATDSGPRRKTRAAKLDGALPELTLKVPSGSHALTKGERINAATVLSTAAEEKAEEKATLALVMACIVEAPFFANPTDGDDTSVGILQLLAMHGSVEFRRNIKRVCTLFLNVGFTGRGGAKKLARDHPDWTAGQVAQAVQGSAHPERYDEVRDAAQKVLDAGGDVSGSSDANAYIRGFAYELHKKESVYACVRRLVDEVNMRAFVREGVMVLASEPALARAEPALVLDPTPDGLLVQDDFDLHRAMAAGEAQLAAWLGRYDADPGETLLLPSLPQTENGHWLIESSVVDLVSDVAVSIKARTPQRPKAEPSTEVVQTGSNTSSGDSGGLKAFCKRISDAGGKYAYGGGHGPKLSGIQGNDGLDCSSSCSLALYRAHLFGKRTVAIASGEFQRSFGVPGRGKEFTVWANEGHVFIQGDGWRFDTGGSGGGNGPRLHEETRDTTGFTPRHVPGH